ncbi:MAG: TLC domain-containing protein [Podila humilis]|nr:MAG: TLC domain-containing protein [Podila humilis]
MATHHKQPLGSHDHSVREKGLANNYNQVMTQQHRKGLLGTMARHQIDAPLVFILAVLTTYTVAPTSFVRRFLFFQEVDILTHTVEKSWNDLYFLFFWIVAFTFLRAAVMTHVLMPLARHWGAASERTVVRFAEQGWICLYYSCSWVLGMYCLQLTPSWNNYFIWFHTDQFFDSYPLTALPLITKYYYWLQFSFWLQQMFVLCIEAPRKDFLAMISHHLVTALLIIASLVLNVTTFGNAVFVAMDLADIVLAFGKCLKYIGMPDMVCDPIFACFMVIWIYTRHFLYGHIIYAWTLYGGEYYSRTTHWGIIGLLMVLQGLMFFWLWSIFRIVYKMFASKGGVVDDRSEDEEEKPAHVHHATPRK